MTEEEKTALEFIRKGATLDDATSASDLPAAQVQRLAVNNGYALNVASRRFQPVPQAKQPLAQGGIVRRTQPPQSNTITIDTASMTTSMRPAHRDLIDEGKAHSSARVQRAATKAQVALEQLSALLDATRAEEAEKRKREAEEAARKQRIAELEQMLAAEKAALRGKRAVAATVARGDTTGPSAKTIRAWAAENGVDCPANGPVPSRVLDAFLAATEVGAA
jgi:DNA-binding transcriptional MerR regulator